ncbi:MAG: restriction endonuclease subunit S [Bacteroidetes bacterium]|nr:restriction endonuclease subunit S [Bacteroidota bacterium]
MIDVEYQNLLEILGFVPKENLADLFVKKYQQDDYCLEVDFANQTINYGNRIKYENKTTQNFSQQENFVVLECVNRLLEKGYKPKNIILEKTFQLGHNNSGRLDILVTREDGTAFMMIECKTAGKEFDKALDKLKKDGGQLFTYFQQDKNADVLVLYASNVKENQLNYENKIINIKEDYKQANNVKELYERWNKKIYDKGIFEKDCEPYNLNTTEKFTIANLVELTEKEGEGLFNKFAEVLRKHSVSDKPNAFSVIFNLFLAKLQDEQKHEDAELEFRWRENDDPVDFQVRLHELHKAGLSAFLKKEVQGILENVNAQKLFGIDLYNAKKQLLKFNKFFSIKEVLDDETFDQNQRVLKEIVELIQKYQIRYPRKQKYLSEFFERLLTIGLKQEVGQFFTPPPITKFIVRSLPLPKLIKEELEKNNPKLPAAIDYAAGSGHFLTELLEEYQNIIDNIDTTTFNAEARAKVKAWSKDVNPYSWAATYIYGIEKDYRLAKVAKVGCYFYGDGLAQVVHADGLNSFEKTKAYRGLLEKNANKPQFSIVVSNPPFSVNDCKDDLEYIYEQYGEKPNNFSIYKSLTYNSKEIECLFVERTYQLLEDGGVAGIILPSSIFSNTGVYTKARELILQYFEIIAITELGSNTFMATGTNTVVLFLRKRNQKDKNNRTLEEFKTDVYNNLEHYKNTKVENTTNEIEKPFSKYIEHTGEKEIDPEKFYYFSLNYWQKVVIVKTGQKEAEKKFLGYKYSNRRGQEAMHPIQRGKTIEECTKLFNENDFEDETKASSYIYKAFNNNYNFTIHESLKNNISLVRLVDMLAFDRTKFTKNISTNIKKKVTIESKWEQKTLNEICEFVGKGLRPASFATPQGEIPFIVSSQIQKKCNTSDFDMEALIIGDGGNVNVHYMNGLFSASDHTYILKLQNPNIKLKYIYNILSNNLFLIESGFTGSGLKNVSKNHLQNIKIPFPPMEIQEKIVAEIESLENKEQEAKEKIKKLTEKIENIINDVNVDGKWDMIKLGDVLFENDKSKIKVGTAKDLNDGEYPFFTSGDSVFKFNEYLVDGENIYLSTGGNAIVKFYDGKAAYSTDTFVIKSNDEEKIKTKFIFIFLESIVSVINEFYFKGVGLKHLQKTDFRNIKIPLPSLSEQERIVSEIEKIELQISDAQTILYNTPLLKNEVLKKYL